MLETFLIVVFESLNCPQCEKMDFKIIQSLLERDLQDQEDFSEEQSSV